MKIAFIGLGVMGYPMASHLAAAGHQLTVFNRSPARAKAWIAANGGEAKDTVGAAAQGQDLVITCVGNDADLREVCMGDNGVIAAMPHASILMDHTTASKTVALELSQAAQERQVGFMDAPVSGGQSGAENGQLSIMCGGPEQVFERVQPALRSYGKSIYLMGPVGTGQLAKMANQICSAGIVQSLAESLRFAQRAGLDVETLLDAMSHGAATSWHMLNRGKTMHEGKFDFGFAVDLVRKDLGLCLNEANAIGASLPTTALIDQFYADLQSKGDGRLDMSSIIKRL